MLWRTRWPKVTDNNDSNGGQNRSIFLRGLDDLRVENGYRFVGRTRSQAPEAIRYRMLPVWPSE